MIQYCRNVSFMLMIINVIQRFKSILLFWGHYVHLKLPKKKGLIGAEMLQQSALPIANPPCLLDSVLTSSIVL